VSYLQQIISDNKECNVKRRITESASHGVGGFRVELDS